MNKVPNISRIDKIASLRNFYSIYLRDRVEVHYKDLSKTDNYLHWQSESSKEISSILQERDKIIGELVAEMSADEYLEYMEALVETEISLEYLKETEVLKESK